MKAIKRGEIVVLLGGLLLWPTNAWAMHLQDGVLSLSWSALGWALALPAVWISCSRLRRRFQAKPLVRLWVAMMTAAVFVVSSIPIPVPFTGTSAHACGTGLAAILLGPAASVALTSVVLLLDAVLLAHGGVLSLGVNLCAMGLVASLVSYGLFHASAGVRVPRWLRVGVACALADLATYVSVALFIGVGTVEPGTSPGLLAGRVLLAFLPIQLPIAVIEGVVSAVAFEFLAARIPHLLSAEGQLR